MSDPGNKTGAALTSELYDDLYSGIILAGLLISTGLNDTLWQLATSFM